MVRAAPGCSACGGTRLRPARSRNGLHRLLRQATALERYACGECGHRGWRLGKLEDRAGGSSGLQPWGGRGHSDRGALPLGAIAFALALGMATAWFILRAAAGRS